MQVSERIIVDMGKAILPKYQFQNHQFKIVADFWTIEDTWFCGPASKDSENNKFDGAFPTGFLNRVKAAFYHYYPQNREDILHVCSGRVPRCEGMRLDIDPKYKPDFQCNAEEMTMIKDNTFQFTVSDTPYNKNASSKYYDKPMVNKSKVFKEMVRVTKPNGFIGVLDEAMPQLNPHLQKQVTCVARIAVSTVPNLTFRAFTVFRKK